MFSDRAIFILEKVSEESDDPVVTRRALTEVANVWGMKDSPKHFSNNFVMEEFSSHSAAHKDANTILYAAQKTNTVWEFIDVGIKNKHIIPSKPQSKIEVKKRNRLKSDKL